MENTTQNLTVHEEEHDIPKIDFPQNWVIGKLNANDIGLLNLYANYPCRLKAGIFILCLDGEIEASIDLTQFKIKNGHFITILPGTIFQIHKIEGDLQIYFLGFSSNFLNTTNINKSLMEIHYNVKENPLYELNEQAISLSVDYFELLIKAYSFYGAQISDSIVNHIFTGVLMSVRTMYKEQGIDVKKLSKAEQTNKNFMQLVIQNYATQRNVAWYAQQLGITQAYLSANVKQCSGKTCTEIITSMVIMDAKAQLKSTDLTVQDIAYSLNFTNMSFFGKYFKRYVGISPQEYRNS